MKTMASKIVAGHKKYTIAKKRRMTERRGDEENEVPSERAQKAEKLIENNQALANELSLLRRENLNKMRRVNVLTRELLSMRLKNVAMTSSASTQTEPEPLKQTVLLSHSMSRRNSRRISYAEPSLKTKMRRPSDFRC